MDGITKLARHIRDIDNPSPYTPMLGTIISLPDLKIRLGSRIILEKEDIKATFDIYETRERDGYTEYVNLNKEVALLPCSNNSIFLVIGVVQ